MSLKSMLPRICATMLGAEKGMIGQHCSICKCTCICRCILIVANPTSCVGVIGDDVILVVMVFFWWHPKTPKVQGFARARQASGLDFVSEDTEAYPILHGASIDNELGTFWRIWLLWKCLLVVQIRSVSPQTWKSDQKQRLANSPVARHVRSIGVGSFGSVRMVEHVKTSARYALKRIKKVNGKALRFIGWSWEGWGEAFKLHWLSGFFFQHLL